MSNFGSKLNEILERIGKDAMWLSAQTGISRAAISKWKTNGARVPKPSSVKRVARALKPYDVTLEELASAAGYSIVMSASPDEREERRLMLMRSSPRWAKINDWVERLDPDAQDEIFSLNEAWMATRRRPKSKGSR